MNLSPKTIKRKSFLTSYKKKPNKTSKTGKDTFQIVKANKITVAVNFEELMEMPIVDRIYYIALKLN